MATRHYTSGDGYPLRATDPDFEMQEQLSRTLDNCRAVAPVHPTMASTIAVIAVTWARTRSTAARSPAMTPMSARLRYLFLMLR